jgi:hypothetical protein
MLPLLLLTAALADPHVALSGTCPGPIDVDVTGATPNSLVWVAVSSGLGQAEVPRGRCRGEHTNLAPLGLRAVPLQTDAQGAAQLSTTTSSCGAAVQAYDPAICDGSAPVTLEETCNGVDDDGDRMVDEGFDLDGDGVARCCDPGGTITTYGAGLTSIDAWSSNGDGTFDAPTTVVSGTAPRFAAVGRFDFRRPAPQIVIRDGGMQRLAACVGGEWTFSAPVPEVPRASIAADVDNDGCLDLLAYDYPCCTFGNSGTGDGTTWLGDCAGGFTELTGTSWNVRVLQGQWTGGAPARLEDFDGDGNVDLPLFALSSGGSTTSSGWYLPGDGAGDFGAAVSLPTIGEAGNGSDMGDVDNDGCVDWVLGPNDDGDDGAVQIVFSDCMGGATDTLLVDACSNCYGDGRVRLADWDRDGDLDLLVSHNGSNGPPFALDFYENEGSGIMLPVLPVTAGRTLPSGTFATPVRP